MVYPRFVDHVVVCVAELGRTERFYTALLGPPSDRTEDSILYAVGDTLLFFTRFDQNRQEPYDKDRVGLNHIAFGVRTPAELRTIQSQLDGAGVTHSGIKLDPYGQKEFIWLDDPDGMRIEFYLRPA